MQRVTVRPGPISGRFSPPGDKSITHRAYLAALLADGETRVAHANPGADCAATLAAACALGLEVVEAGAEPLLRGRAMRPVEPDRALDCGNSGTTLRLLSGVLAAQPFFSVLHGDHSLNRRPIARVIEPLRQMGASLWARDQDRYPPLAIRGAVPRPIHYRLKVASAQVASCVLLAALFADGETSVEIPGPARDHTERIFRTLGASIREEPLAGGGRRVVMVGPVRLSGAQLRVPGDLSCAAFFLAAAAATPSARVTATGVNLNPLRTGLLDVLEAMGAGVERSCVRMEGGEEVGDVSVVGPARLKSFDVPPGWVPRLIDEVPAWIVAAAAASGTSHLSGASELRFKESDRLAVLAANLAAIGIVAHESVDGLAITGGPIEGGEIRAAGDHRIAMAFAALATGAAKPVAIDDASAIGTSYPGFLDTLTALGGRVELHAT